LRAHEKDEAMSAAATQPPELEHLVEVRGRRWVVAGVDPGAAGTLLDLQSVEEGRYGDTLEVIWEIEPGRRILPSGSLPEVDAGAFDAPGELAAFLDAVRWSAVTSADVKTLQAPLRSGAEIEDYQLEPLARAVDAPRVNLLLADDVGLGKTVEAGLVAHELLLRHRARRIMIVCPAGLTVKWRDEMAERFGLDFQVIDSECCALLRRERGSAANPFEVYPQAIVSLPWLRGRKAQRLLDEMLPPGGPSYPRTFDLLILDEAHHVAPAAPKQLYAVDSQQTRLIRRLAPHFAHRLFLSATPHNGYLASFTALLEILDGQRFARGVTPDRQAVAETVVRRLKRDIVHADGTPRFAARETRAIPVEYPEDERRAHKLLSEFAAARRKKLDTRVGRKATDLVTLLLKKRLFSSPAAFAHTVGRYTETLRTKAGRPPDEVPDWLEDYWNDAAGYDDEQLAEAEDDAVDATRPMQPDPSGAELGLLAEMVGWAAAYEAEPDAKARELITYLTGVCKADEKDWTNNRVVVFTEYRDTQRWLAELLRAAGMGAPEVAILHGGMPDAEREQLRLAFQAPPTEHSVRILLATDAAGEGIDLQNHCHRLVNYDIPFNPNKLEQRIGRIDRYGQRETPEIRHFVGTGFSRAVDPYEADLEFLSRVAGKVARMEEDLGSVNAVLADAVQRRMLGEDPEVDVESAGEAKQHLRIEQNVREQVRRLRDNVTDTVSQLGITPEAVARVVGTALELSGEQPLRPALDPAGHEDSYAEGLYSVPPLTGSWSRVAEGLTEKLHREGEPPRQLPITFDDAVARGRDDIVLAHLNHPLVARSTELLRAAVSNERVGLHRVAAVISDHPSCEDVLVGAYSRFVLLGADGVRLHEEVLYAGGWAPEQGLFRRVESLSRLREVIGPALARGEQASEAVTRRLAARWPRAGRGLVSALDARAATRRESLARALDGRQRAEERRIRAEAERFERTLRSALAADEADGALFSEADLRSEDERRQYRRDRQSWEERLAGLETARDRELEMVANRYRDPKPHSFPVAVVFVVPRWEATR
jgi:superfamily II DNA or RNA helicase